MIKRLKEHIKNTGLKKQKVAELIGIHQVHLSGILSGKRVLTKDVEDKIRVYLK